MRLLLAGHVLSISTACSAIYSALRASHWPLTQSSQTSCCTRFRPDYTRSWHSKARRCNNNKCSQRIADTGRLDRNMAVYHLALVPKRSIGPIQRSAARKTKSSVGRSLRQDDPSATGDTATVCFGGQNTAPSLSRRPTSLSPRLFPSCNSISDSWLPDRCP